MTRKQIDAARETRLWIGQVVVPAATAVVTVMSIPEVRGAIAAKARQVKNDIELKIHKKKREE